MAHNTPVVIFFMIPVVSILLALTFHCYGVSVIAFILCVFDVMILPCALNFFTEPLSNGTFQIKLLPEVITRKPAVKSEEWRSITNIMNRYLFDQELWNTPYYFYRRKECHRYLLNLLAGKSFDVHSLSSISPVMEAQLDAPTTGSSNDENGTFTFSPGPDFQMCLYKAAVIEQESQREYWRKQYPNTGLV